MYRYCPLLTSLLWANIVFGGQPLDVWPQLAPGETTRQLGEKLPPRAGEAPLITRVTSVTRPTMTVHVADQPTGT